MTGRPRLALDEADQLSRLASFRAAHPEVIIGDLGFGKVWQARIPEDETDGESVFTRYTLRELLDQLAMIFRGLEGPRGRHPLTPSGST